MPQFTSSEEWQRQSALLIRAHPTTTRITTKYNIPNLSSDRHVKKQRLRREKAAKTATLAQAESKSLDTKDDGTKATTTNDTPSTTVVDASKSEPDTRPPKASFTLKTFDTATGVTLKYRTDKAAEVGRLVGAMGRLARDMALLPEEPESVTSIAAEAKDVASAAVLDAVDNAKAVAVAGKSEAKVGMSLKRKKRGKR